VLNIELQPNKDILAEVASLPNAPFCVGFAAETQDLLKHAETKRQTKKIPLLIANLVGESMGQDEASITLLDNNGGHALPRANKKVLASEILMHLSRLI
jgi:phosphopantothenoylcysteine decarboxylase/phosphopantothenate--cysteine ligase